MNLLIVQARMGSSRLPGKVMKKINNVPLLHILIKRILGSNFVDSFMVATSLNSEDDIIAEFCKENKIFSEKLFKTHYFPVGISDELKIESCIKSNYNLNIIFKMCKNECSLDEIAESCNISKSMASKRLQILESLGAIKKIKVEKKIKFCIN